MMIITISIKLLLVNFSKEDLVKIVWTTSRESKPMIPLR